MLKIGEFSKLSRVSIRMLRHYDEIGLLNPVHIDPDSGYRYYNENQLPVVGRIAALKDMGFGLSEVAQLLFHYEDKSMLEQYFLEKQTEIMEERQQLEKRLRLLDTAIQRLRKDENMKYDVSIKTFPARYAACVRMKAPTYEHEGMLWGILMEDTASLNMIEDEPCYCCAVFHDKEFKEADVDIEVYKTVKGTYSDTEHVKFQTLPEVTVASAICKGSYEQMNDIMAVIAQWIIDNGYELKGPVFNIYHISPHETANPEEFVTEVCYPVRKK